MPTVNGVFVLCCITVLAEAEALSASAKGEVRVTEDEMAEFDVKQN